MELLSVRTYEITVCVYRKINCSVRIVTIFIILAFFFIHGKFHIFFHAVFFAVKIIVETSVFCVCYRIFRVFSVYLIELFHQRPEAVHIRSILFYVIYCDIFITDTELNIVARQQLIVSHIVLFHTHECCVVIGLGVAVAVITAYLYVFCIFFSALRCIASNCHTAAVLQFYDVHVLKLQFQDQSRKDLHIVSVSALNIQWRTLHECRILRRMKRFFHSSHSASLLSLQIISDGFSHSSFSIPSCTC